LALISALRFETLLCPASKGLAASERSGKNLFEGLENFATLFLPSLPHLLLYRIEAVSIQRSSCSSCFGNHFLPPRNTWKCKRDFFLSGYRSVSGCLENFDAASSRVSKAFSLVRDVPNIQLPGDACRCWV